MKMKRCQLQKSQMLTSLDIHEEVNTLKSCGKTRNPQNSLTQSLEQFLHKKIKMNFSLNYVC